MSKTEFLVQTKKHVGFFKALGFYLPHSKITIDIKWGKLHDENLH